MSLTDDLNSYLKKNSSSNSLSNLTGKLKLPTLKSPFGSSSTPEDEQPFLENQDVESGGLGGGGGSSSGGWWKSRMSASTSPSNSNTAWLPALSKKQRICGFMTSIILGVICFGLATMYIPFIVLKARKFSLLFSLGSLFTITSFSFLYGPWNHLIHLFSKDRLPFTLVYLSTLSGTLYFAMSLQNTVLTCLAATAQVVALVYFIVSYMPGGQKGLKFFTKLCSGLCKSTVNNSLPV